LIAAGYITAAKKEKTQTPIELYKQAIAKYGIPSQLNMLAEESAEQAKVALKLQRPSTPESPINLRILQLAEEIADVQICQEQIIDHFNLQDLIQFYRANKLSRLQCLVEASP
jgi:hypothetical protein